MLTSDQTNLILSLPFTSMSWIVFLKIPGATLASLSDSLTTYFSDSMDGKKCCQ